MGASISCLFLSRRTASNALFNNLTLCSLLGISKFGPVYFGRFFDGFSDFWEFEKGENLTFLIFGDDAVVVFGDNVLEIGLNLKLIALELGFDAIEGVRVQFERFWQHASR